MIVQPVGAERTGFRLLLIWADDTEMDTGDLSEETYRAIMIEAEMFNHDLTIQFGLLSRVCKDEDDFIEKSVRLIEAMKAFSEADLDDLFFGNSPEMKYFHAAISRIRDNIKQVKKIPPEKRTYYFG